MTYSAEVLADAPDVYLPCQETSGATATDLSGNSRNGTYGGTVTLDDTVDPGAPVGVGKHVRLDGTTGHIVLHNGAWLTPATSGFTFEGWFYIRTHADFARIYDFAAAASSQEMYLAPRGNNGSAWLRHLSATISDMPVIATGSWKHVVLTINAGSAGGGAGFGVPTLYVDGVAVFSAGSFAQNDVARPNRYVGRSSFPSDPFLAASVSQIAVYNKALTSARVAAHYAAGGVVFRAVETDIAQPITRKTFASVMAGLPWAAWWRFGGNGADSSGNARTLNAFGISASAASLLVNDANAATSNNGGTNFWYIDNASWMNLTSGITVVMRYKPTAVTGRRGLVARKGSGGTGPWSLEANGTDVRVVGTTGILTFAAGLVANTTYTLGFTYDPVAGLTTLFVNGLPVAASTTVVITNTSQRFTVGALSSTSDGSFGVSGTMDEVGYSGTALTYQQMADIHAAALDVTPVTVIGIGGQAVETDIAQPMSGYHPLAQAIAQDGAASYWKFAETSGTVANDSIGGRHGTYAASGVTLGQAALPAQGNDSAVRVSGAGRVTLPGIAASQFTFEIWHTPTSGSGTIASRYNGVSPGNGSWTIRYDSGVPTFYLFKTGYQSVSSGMTLSGAAVYHIAVTYDNVNIRIYINGVLKGTTACTGSPIEQGLPITIGGTSGADEQGAGYYDEAAFFPTALSGPQIAAHYAAGLLPPAQVIAVGQAVETDVALAITALLPTGPTIKWYDGAAEQVTTLEGWWDGAVVQSVGEVKWWDGAAEQPLG